MATDDHGFPIPTDGAGPEPGTSDASRNLGEVPDFGAVDGVLAPAQAEADAAPAGTRAPIDWKGWGKRLLPWVLAALVVATSVVVAGVSVWLVPPYLVVVGLILFTPGKPQDDEGEGDPPPDGDDPGGLSSPKASRFRGWRSRMSRAQGEPEASEEPGEEPADEPLEVAVEPAVEAQAEAPSGKKRRRRASADAEGAEGEPGSETPSGRGRRGRGKAMAVKPMAQAAEATWVQVAPGKFVRVEGAVANAAGAGPHDMADAPGNAVPQPAQFAESQLSDSFATDSFTVDPSQGFSSLSGSTFESIGLPPLPATSDAIASSWAPAPPVIPPHVPADPWPHTAAPAEGEDADDSEPSGWPEPAPVESPPSVENVEAAADTIATEDAGPIATELVSEAGVETLEPGVETESDESWAAQGDDEHGIEDQGGPSEDDPEASLAGAEVEEDVEDADEVDSEGESETDLDEMGAELSETAVEEETEDAAEVEGEDDLERDATVEDEAGEEDVTLEDAEEDEEEADDEELEDDADGEVSEAAEDESDSEGDDAEEDEEEADAEELEEDAEGEEEESDAEESEVVEDEDASDDDAESDPEAEEADAEDDVDPEALTPGDEDAEDEDEEADEDDEADAEEDIDESQADESEADESEAEDEEAESEDAESEEAEDEEAEDEEAEDEDDTSETDEEYEATEDEGEAEDESEGVDDEESEEDPGEGELVEEGEEGEADEEASGEEQGEAEDGDAPVAAFEPPASGHSYTITPEALGFAEPEPSPLNEAPEPVLADALAELGGKAWDERPGEELEAHAPEPAESLMDETLVSEESEDEDPEDEGESDEDPDAEAFEGALTEEIEETEEEEEEAEEEAEESEEEEILTYVSPGTPRTPSRRWGRGGSIFRVDGPEDSSPSFERAGRSARRPGNRPALRVTEPPPRVKHRRQMR